MSDRWEFTPLDAEGNALSPPVTASRDGSVHFPAEMIYDPVPIMEGGEWTAHGLATMKDGPIVKCGTCRHWTPPTERTDFRNIFRGDEVDRLFGICEKINLADSYDPAPDQIPLAVTKDGSDYMADLFTQESFGCALWEAKS